MSVLFCVLVSNGQPALQWDLVDKIVQQIVLQTKDGDPDVKPLEIVVKIVIKQCVCHPILEYTHERTLLFG